MDYPIRNAKLTQVVLKDGVLADRQETAHTTTIPVTLQKCKDTGRIDTFKLNWVPGSYYHPHVFFDSDTAKVLEGMAYSLAERPNAEMEREYDALVDLIVSAQEADGYLNSYFSRVAPERRWAELGNLHELYCAGHLIEAAVAGYEYLGKRKLLDAMCRYADYIAKVFGTAKDQKRGYPGHEEIELALVRLYQATGEKRYLQLAKYFIDERGKKPLYFVDVEHSMPLERAHNQQADKPVRDQHEAYGHSVRAVYLYSGMTDVAQLTDDDGLMAVCKELFDNITLQKMYVSGGIGSTFQGEKFTNGYDLPNGGQMYAESCAQIGMTFFADRLYRSTGEAKYVDVIEREIYNGAMSGISLEGTHFYYGNKLEVNETTYFPNEYTAYDRKDYFSCSCCPTNFCRYLTEMSQYLFSEDGEGVRVNIPAAATYDGALGLSVTGGYPYDGAVRIEVTKGGAARLAVRIPGWCRKAAFTRNGAAVTPDMKNGFACLAGPFAAGDVITVTYDMPIERYHCNLHVTANAGCVAIMRGPILYCAESTDNPGMLLSQIVLGRDTGSVIPASGLPEGTKAIVFNAELEENADPSALYTTEEPVRKAGHVTLVPYALWGNRGRSAIQVWMRNR